MHQENVTFVIIGKGFRYEPYLCSGCYDLMQKAIV